MTAAETQPSLLPQAVREKLEAIVFDTNSFPNGGLRLSTLKEWERWARLAGLEIWLPEPVVWELAEHAATAWHELQTITNRAGKALSHAGLQARTASPYGSRDDVIKEIEAKIRSLGTTVHVLRLDGDVAVDALKDQILQRKPAKSRDGVKTGASDSAWLRQVLKNAGGDPDKFVIVGGDKDVYEAFREWKLSTPWMVPLRDLQKALFVLEEPDASVVEKIASFVRNAITAPLEGGRHPDGTLEIGEIKDPARLIDDWEADSLGDARLASVDAFAGLGQVKINRLTGAASAQVFLSAQVEYTNWTLDADGQVWTRSGLIAGVVVRDVLSFTLEDGGVSRAESESGEAESFRSSGADFDDAEQAFSELMDTLTLVPGVEVTPGLSAAAADLEVGGEFSIFLGAHTLTLTSEETNDGGWMAELTLSTAGSSQSIEVRCEWDAAKNPWEMPELFPAWVVSVEDEIARRAPGIWGASAWVIENMIPGNDPAPTPTP
ncbi:hypothetical protein [Streptomyces sp. NPDC004230]